MLAVDNLNGIELCERTILVDHVKQYKIPKEYMCLSSNSESSHGEESDNSSFQRKREAKAKEKFESKLYKPTGPYGRGWGDFREVTKEERITLEEL